MKFFKSSSIATLVAICFFFVAFAGQPAEAMSHKSKSTVSAPAKSKKLVKKTKKAVKAKKEQKAKKVQKAKSAKKSVAKSKKASPSFDPAAQ